MNAKPILLLFSLLIGLAACNADQSTSRKLPAPHKYVDYQKNQFDRIRTTSDCIVFKLYLLRSTSTVRDERTVLWHDSVTDSTRLQAFNSLFTSVKNGGYCCCKKAHYILSFYEKGKKIGSYNIDTSEVKGKATLFGNGYQPSFTISLKDLNSVIKKPF